MFNQILEGFRRTSHEVRVPAPADEYVPERRQPAAPRGPSITGLRIKSYYASSVEAAVEMARQELGPEAMIVNSMRTGPEARELGEYEVVFAVPPSAGAPAARRASAPAPRCDTPAEAPSLNLLFGEITELRRQLESMRHSRIRPAYRGSRLLASSRQLADCHEKLVASDLSFDFAQEIVECVDARLSLLDPAPSGAGERVFEESALRRALVQELESRFSVDAALGVPGAPAVVVLVGPPGAGKTSTLVKLAVKFGLTARKPVQVVSMDNYRVAGGAQLRSFASILGVGFTGLETANALAQCLEEHKSKGLVLVDTPGYGVNDLDAGMELARFLSARPNVDTHLVLPASMKAADIARAVDRFEVFAPRKLAFTRLDETDAFGPIPGESARTGKPVSFLADGQRIPEDLEPARKERILDLVLPREAAPAA